jgi:hypothetical protein
MRGCGKRRGAERALSRSRDAASLLPAATEGYQPTATTMYCGLATDRSEDWPLTSS